MCSLLCKLTAQIQCFVVTGDLGFNSSSVQLEWRNHTGIRWFQQVKNSTRMPVLSMKLITSSEFWAIIIFYRAMGFNTVLVLSFGPFTGANIDSEISKLSEYSCTSWPTLDCTSRVIRWGEIYPDPGEHSVFLRSMLVVVTFRDLVQISS